MMYIYRIGHTPMRTRVYLNIFKKYIVIKINCKPTKGELKGTTKLAIIIDNTTGSVKYQFYKLMTSSNIDHIIFQLFDYDIEVKPILEVLVGKTVEQALLEVMEEEELANLRAQQRAFEELRNAEHVEQQKLEEQERRHREEKVG